MLAELDIRDLAVAEHVRVSFAAGLTVITGETGAGKSIIVDALELLLGGRPDPALVRAGADAARIEGVFYLPDAELPEELAATLAEAGVEPEDGTLIVSREVQAAGRARTARINGRAVVQSALAALGNRLVDIHGQTDHVALLQPADHVRYLDRFAGLGSMRSAFGAGVQRLRRLRTEIDRLATDERERLRRQDRLNYEVAEIEAAQLRPDEEDELRAERSLLENAEQIAALSDAVITALTGGGRGGSAVDALGRAAEALAQLVLFDARLADQSAAATALQEQAADLAREIRAHRDRVEFNPRRLELIEERLSLLSSLKRKYGSTIADVIAYADRARDELAEIEGGEERRAELEAEALEVEAALADQGRQLAVAREEAAARLTDAIHRELADLQMGGARFGVAFTRRGATDGLCASLRHSIVVGSSEDAGSATPDRFAFDQTGLDRVEFYASFNAGEPLRPLARVASGGETSRLMLALKSVLGNADAVPTLVFDEIEAGLGARTGGVVGEKLARLADHHQVICITHLPQIAARAERHLAVGKGEVAGRTRAEVHELAGEARVQELAAMMGSVTPATLAGAYELLNGPEPKIREKVKRR